MSTPTDFASRRSDSGRSTTTTVIAIAVALVVVAGAAFGVYKLTRTKDKGTPIATTVKSVFTAWQDGDKAAAGAHMTDSASTDLFAIKAADGKGLVFGNCQSVGATVFPLFCRWTRPGGQLGMRVVRDGEKNVIDAISYGPAGLPPAVSTPPST